VQVVIVHYHLNRGGVTQVIANHLRSLASTATDDGALRVAVFHGGRRDGWPDRLAARLPGIRLTIHETAALDYNACSASQDTTLARTLETKFQQLGFGPDNTVVHFHNHALGKNPAVPGMLARLAAGGWPLLLQIHDFAEDYRPANYRAIRAAAVDLGGTLSDWLYPQGSAIHYAVLNGRDRAILHASGVAGARLHWLPNPVIELHSRSDRDAARQRLLERFGVSRDSPYILYPVRGIRRKNIGELLLWAAIAPPSVRLAVTLAPLNPVERTQFDAWKQLARTLDLPVLFDTGGVDGLAFSENLAAADRLITTSVAEGFGMVYLESWLCGRLLTGRDLPDITRDFQQQGVRLPGLYEQLHVPVDWVGHTELVTQYDTIARAAWGAYACPLPPRATVAEQLDALMEDGCLDFARFPTRLQARIISMAASSPPHATELWERNPAMGWLKAAVEPDAAELIGANAAAVRRHYGVDASGARLRELYQKVLDSPRAERYRLPDGAAILEAFLALRRLYPARVER